MSIHITSLALVLTMLLLAMQRMSLLQKLKIPLMILGPLSAVATVTGLALTSSIMPEPDALFQFGSSEEVVGAAINGCLFLVVSGLMIWTKKVQRTNKQKKSEIEGKDIQDADDFFKCQIFLSL